MAMSKKRRIFYSLITLIAIVLCAFSFSVKVHGAPGDETGEGDKQELIDEFETNVSALFGYSEEFDQTINSIFDYLATFIDSESDYGALVDTISNLKHKTIVCSMRSPYDSMYLDGIENYICMYEVGEDSLRTLAKALKGEIKFSGKLPVKLI